MAAPRTRTFLWEPGLAARAPRPVRDPFAGRRVAWSALFQTDQPTEVEIGCGTGAFLVEAARATPAHNFFGIEPAPRPLAVARRTILAARLDNVRLLAADARCAVMFLIPHDSVSAYHIYFPDPWWKRRHHKRRLLTPAFTDALARTLRPGGLLHLATDIEPLAAALCASFAAAGLRAGPLTTPPPQTRFAWRCTDATRVVHRFAFRRD